jgi:deoxyxylulose-5-phosphate synthase
MTPNEYSRIWDNFMAGDDPMLVSEHRDSFLNTRELQDIVVSDADVTLYAISATRFEAEKSVEALFARGIRCNLVHIVWLKPFEIDNRLVAPLLVSEKGLVIDAGHEIAGASQTLAYELNQATGCKVKALGLNDRTKCLNPYLQNRTPDAARIADVVEGMLRF